MAPLTDPERIAAYRDVLGNWSVTDFIRFELSKQANRWVRRNLDGITLRELCRLMFEHVNAGGEIDEVPEKREQWAELYEYHYDLQLAIRDQLVYIETRLHFSLPVVPDKSWIVVVNIHEC